MYQVRLAILSLLLLSRLMAEDLHSTTKR